jgi:predicted Zn-ribbon and HTH transcriptional regulator
MSRVRKRREALPAERYETVRQEIRTFLEGPPATIREISQAVRASEKEVLGHLEHLERSLSGKGIKFIISPAECEKCGFVFQKRKRLKKPGRCPLCRSSAVCEPLFSVQQH